MTALLRPAVRFVKAEDGPTAVEYAVMLALIIIVCLVAVTAIGKNSSQTFSAVGSVDQAGVELSTATPHAGCAGGSFPGLHPRLSSPLTVAVRPSRLCG